MTNGKSWEAGKTPGGRFCNVFELGTTLLHGFTSIWTPTIRARTSLDFGGAARDGLGSNKS